MLAAVVLGHHRARPSARTVTDVTGGEPWSTPALVRLAHGSAPSGPRRRVAARRRTAVLTSRPHFSGLLPRGDLVHVAHVIRASSRFRTRVDLSSPSFLYDNSVVDPGQGGAWSSLAAASGRPECIVGVSASLHAHLGSSETARATQTSAACVLRSGSRSRSRVRTAEAPVDRLGRRGGGALDSSRDPGEGTRCGSGAHAEAWDRPAGVKLSREWTPEMALLIDVNLVSTHRNGGAVGVDGDEHSYEDRRRPCRSGRGPSDGRTGRCDPRRARLRRLRTSHRSLCWRSVSCLKVREIVSE